MIHFYILDILKCRMSQKGDLAQSVEYTVSNGGAEGSKPSFSIIFCHDPFADQVGLPTSKLTGTLPSMIGVLSAVKTMSVTLSYPLPLLPPFRNISCGEGRENYHAY